MFDLIQLQGHASPNIFERQKKREQFYREDARAGVGMQSGELFTVTVWDADKLETAASAVSFGPGVLLDTIYNAPPCIEGLAASGVSFAPGVLLDTIVPGPLCSELARAGVSVGTGILSDVVIADTAKNELAHTATTFSAGLIE